MPMESPPDTEHERADADTLKEVYKMLLDQLTLTKAHAKNLENRGLSADAIERRGYKSMRGKGRAAVARKLADRFGVETLLRAPGFYLRHEDGRKWISIAGPDGLYIPVRDKGRRVMAIKIRLDDPKGGPRYLYLSSARHGGHGPGAAEVSCTSLPLGSAPAAISSNA